MKKNWDFHKAKGRWPGSWVGLTDAAREGLWVWSDGTTLDKYKNFAKGEPNGGRGENCGFFYHGHGDKARRC